MNQRRLAAIHRQLAELHRELAELYGEEPANDARPPKRRMEPLPEPQPPTDVDVARARRSLARRGYR